MNHGRIDLTVVLQRQVFLFECKVVADGPEGRAEKYLGQGADVHLIGVESSKTARNAVGFEVETITG